MQIPVWRGQRNGVSGKRKCGEAKCEYICLFLLFDVMANICLCDRTNFCLN